MSNSKVSRAIRALAPLAVLTACSLAAANPEIRGPALEMSVYLDTTGADSVLAGDFEQAIKKIATHSPVDNMGSLAMATNLCVAYTLTQRWDEAKSRCDAAISGARASGADDVFDFGAARNKRLASAYSNRAVLKWLQNQKQQAIADVNRARSLAPRLDFVGRNWTVLNGQPDSTVNPRVASIRP